MTAFTDINIGSSPNDDTGTEQRAAGTILNDNFDLAANKSEANVFDGFVSFGVESVTIASGIVTITKSYIAVTGEGAAIDNLDTITMTGGNVDGTLLVVKIVGSADITVTETGNIFLGDTTRVLLNGRDKLVLIYDSTAAKWTELSFTIN